MFDRDFKAKLELVANRKSKERNYWLERLVGPIERCGFPYDFDGMKRRSGGGVDKTSEFQTLEFRLSGDLFARLIRLSKGNDHTLHMVLTTALLLLLGKYTGRKDIITGTSIYKQKIETRFVNTVLALRNRLDAAMSFKQLLIRVRQSIIEAVEHRNYPIEILLEQLNLPVLDRGFPLFDAALLLENIQDKKYIGTAAANLVFYFFRAGEHIEARLEYNALCYERGTIARIGSHYTCLLESALANPGQKIFDIDMLTEVEKKQLLVDFNDTTQAYPLELPIHLFIEKQAGKMPGNRALYYEGQQLSYRQLQEKSNRLTRVLRKNGVTGETVVGIMMERSLDSIISLLAILKAGGAYLPINPELPRERILYMLADAGAKVLISSSDSAKAIPFTALQGVAPGPEPTVVLTAPREHIADFDTLPMPDRKLIHLKNYKNKIGMAGTVNGMSLQATRGCPYGCVFCHKVWSKHHVYRSAEKIYEEIRWCREKGVKNFAFIDDCFNLDIANSTRFFQLIIKNKPDLRLFFPNGLRGDLLTPGYIDLMVEAGTRGINLSLETASPRLQRLIKKNLDIEKFKQVMDYIAAQHPGIILELAAMHGLPGETEEEALLTLDFIKSIQWIHFPYIHILKVYPNTEMEALAKKYGIVDRDIMVSKDLAFHQLPATLPFPKAFTRKYQTRFMNEYFLSKARLKKVLPVQMKILGSRALVQKYDTYLPVDIESVADIIEFAGLEDMEIPRDYSEKSEAVPAIFQWEPGRAADSKETVIAAKKVLLLDLSQHFSSYSMLYNVSEQPLGLISLLTCLKHTFGDQVDGRIYKSGNDFDGYDRLRKLVVEYSPDLVGIRTLTFYREFFHETVSLLRQWGVHVPLIAGGPYATSDYKSILQDEHIDLVVLGEGECTMVELIEKMLANDFKMPPPGILKTIKGIAFAHRGGAPPPGRRVIFPDRLAHHIQQQDPSNLELVGNGNNLAYVMYTSGSTGQPKGVMVEHRQVNNCIFWMQNKFKLDEKAVIVHRTNLSFDPSVWEIFWPLYLGGSVRVLTRYQGKDARYLLQLLSEENDLTMMYCPATLLSAMTYLLNTASVKPRLKLPWLIIGAEPIRKETVKDFYRCFEGKIVNTYGPNECTINNTYYDLEPGDPRAIVPIGKPVANNRIYILADGFRVMPTKVAGEICIAGDSVARGYINNPARTNAAFKQNPWGAGKIYKSGDMGRWLEDGNIEILGRIDNQVKLRGYRIEPGEIESALAAHPDIREALVLMKDNRSDDTISTCKGCGITSNYPNIDIGDDGFCNVCESLNQYKKTINSYFKTLDDLSFTIAAANKQKRGKYDCLLLYAGGRGAAYALYRLVDMGFDVLTVTYDNGYFGKANLEGIRRITSRLGVDHVVLTHQNSDKIMKESMKIAGTVCRGCFHTSASLAGEYAYKNNIKVVVGATLSRGQIIENKLYMFLRQGITQVENLEHEISKLQKSAPTIDKDIFKNIDIEVINSGLVYDKVTFLDFYRYCDISNRDMISYLNHRSPYWKTRKNYAVYSTNCPIKQVGDYGHLEERGYHYYGGATSWEKRLGHITPENLKEDLECRVNRKSYEAFSKRIDYMPKKIAEQGNRYLCAYIISAKELQAEELRGILSKRLPEYMIPAYFVMLERWPLTPDGKVDRSKLPAPLLNTGAGYIAPRDDIEEKLAVVWAEVLGSDAPLAGNLKIGIDDSFFELGGHSLKATILVSKVHKELDIKLPLVEIFKNPSIRAISHYIKSNPEERFVSIPLAPPQKYYPLSSAQKRLYIARQRETGSIRYNMPQALVLQGEIEKEKLENTFRKLIKRHDSLRTSFQIAAGEVVQQVHDEVEFPVQYREVNPSTPVDSLIQDFIKPFDLSKAPLLRAGLFKLAFCHLSNDDKPNARRAPALIPPHVVGPPEAGSKYLLLFDMHHIISDGVSMEIFEREFLALYQGKDLPGLRLQYKDYSVWRQQEGQEESIKRQERYWLAQFAHEIPVLNMPTDYPRPPLQQFTGSEIDFEINSELTARLKTLMPVLDVTLYMVLLAVYNILLSKYTGQQAILIGSPVSGRTHADLHHIIGLFANIVVMKNKPGENKTFGEFLQEVKENALKAYENQDYQFDRLVESLCIPIARDRHPLIDTVFTLQNVTLEDRDKENSGDLNNLKIFPYRFPQKRIQHELLLKAELTGDILRMGLEYSITLFKESTAQAMANHYIEILEQVTRDSEIRLKEIEISHDMAAVSINIEDEEDDFKF